MQKVASAEKNRQRYDGLSLVRAYLKLRPQKSIKKAQKGQILTHESDYAVHSILLLEGWVALSKTLPEGGSQIFDIMLPGDFGLVGAKVAPVSAFTVEALTDIRFIVIPAAQMNGPEDEQALLRELFAAMLVITQARTSELLLRMARSKAESRLAYALLELYVRLERVDSACDGRFNLPLTQQRLGEFAGLSNVHVCRTMRRFERQGLVDTLDDHDLQLNDLDTLSKLADIDLELFREEILLGRPG